jgi:hypothetical protein
LHKRKKKIIVPILIVILFLGLALTPGISATAEKVKEHQLTIKLQDPYGTGGGYEFRKLVTQSQLEEINNSVCEFIMLAKDSMDENSADGSNITDSEWGNLINKIDSAVDILGTIIGKEFPVEDTKYYISQVSSTLLKFGYTLRQPLISIGLGITWIPFYDYESMIGRLIKPVFIHHVLGFSATFKLNPFKLGFPSLSYGLHRVRTFFFQGLLIDFSDLGYDRIIGPQILIGYGLFTGFA